MNNFFEINEIIAKYDNNYHEMNDIIKKAVRLKKYFYGSSDTLGFYEPSLTNRLYDKRSGKGRFSSSAPKSGAYFEYWYDGENRLIKIKFISRETLECYDVIVKYEGNIRLYLFYDYKNINSAVQLSHIYKLKYENDLLTNLTVYIRDNFINTCAFYETQYMYEGRHLKIADESLINGPSLHFEFFYGDDGYMSSYVFDDGHHSYKSAADRKIIEKFEKCGLYHFSPEK